jgi:hypothetical protein
MKRQPVQSEEMPVFIGIDYHKAYSVYNVQGESCGKQVARATRINAGSQRLVERNQTQPECRATGR